MKGYQSACWLVPWRVRLWVVIGIMVIMLEFLTGTITTVQLMLTTTLARVSYYLCMCTFLSSPLGEN